jgi:dienelactone hydrolase
MHPASTMHPATTLHPATAFKGDQGLSLQRTMETESTIPGAASACRLEFSSRGDRVPTLFVTPQGKGPHSTVVIVHSAGSSKSAPELDLAGFVAAGHATLTIDLPLHGERSSSKLTECLLAAIRGGARDANTTSLLAQFARQSESDVHSALDIALTLPDLDADRIGLAGVGVGALFAARVGADDPRPVALALAGMPTADLPQPLDASRHVDRIAPRPLLQIETDGDEMKTMADFFATSL